MRKSVLNTALSTALIAALGFGVSACSGDKEGEHGSHEVMAVDRVDEAAELARANAPEAQEMDFPETAVTMPAAEGDVAAEGATTDTAATEEGAADTDMAETAATDSTDAGVTGANAGAGTESTDTAATDAAAPQ